MGGFVLRKLTEALGLGLEPRASAVVCCTSEMVVQEELRPKFQSSASLQSQSNTVKGHFVSNSPRCDQT